MGSSLSRLVSVRWRSAALLLVVATLACHTGRNYPDAAGPRYEGAPSIPAAARSTDADTLRVVSFNIAFARHADSAAVVLASDPVLRDADVILLQEMDAPSARHIAEALGMWHVYYPAIHHLRAHKDFGNAVLSRWPIVGDAKIQLPHTSRYAGTQRTATAATIRVGESLVRVYSTHLGTPADIGSGARRDQMRTILADAAPFDRVVIGGDMNSGSVGEVARDAGYAWPTERGPHTTRLGRWDHIFVRGFVVPDSGFSGTASHVKGISDHVPVWVAVMVR
jgi:endonuclease/exonuclease/phosphatase family metal-dependent hydrolase